MADPTQRDSLGVVDAQDLYPHPGPGVLAQMGDGGHETVTHVVDEPTGLRAIIAIHSTVLGPALGGLRWFRYPTEQAALTDVLRLSQGMTLKNAAAGLSLGGGKAVIVDDGSITDRKAALEAFGGGVERLGGAYITAEDVGTTVADLVVVSNTTSHVAGLDEAHGGSGDPSPLTARGIVASMRAAASRLWGSDSLEGRTVAIQGVGKVGSNLARLLAGAGASLIVSDRSEDAVASVVGATGANVVGPNEILSVPCDILAPCAMGAVLDETTILSLHCRAVVGSANNQLATEQDATRLAEAGILYVPDFVANAGGVINIAVERQAGGYSRSDAERAVDAIGARVGLVLDTAGAGSTVDAAKALAGDRLHAARPR